MTASAQTGGNAAPSTALVEAPVTHRPAQTADLVERALSGDNGILRLRPCWVARDLVPPGRRLGLPESAYDVGERGFICERWLGSVTPADNRIGPPDEGLSYLEIEGANVTFADAVAAAPHAIMGSAYASTHDGLGRLAKLFDYGYRLPYHLHLRQAQASLVGRRSKDEAYYFPPGFDMGAHPETFFGVHPWIAEGARETLLPYLRDWNGDEILGCARGFQQLPEEGFDVPSGVLHAPGTALTIELQEDSDVLAIFQAKNAGKIVSKDLLFKDVRPQDRERYGEAYALDLVDWELNGDPYFYEHRNLSPQPVAGSATPAGEKWWIFYANPKFAGKKVVVHAGASYRSAENGVYTVFVLAGTGTVDGHRVKAGDPAADELLVAHSTATRGVEILNDGSEALVLIEFFGPDLNPDAPAIPPYPRPS